MAVPSYSADDLQGFLDRRQVHIDAAKSSLGSCRWWQVHRKWRLNREIAERLIELRECRHLVSKIEAKVANP